MNQIEQAKGRAATEAEVAEGLKIPLEEYQQWIDQNYTDRSDKA